VPGGKDMSTFETLIYEKKDHIARVTINRPRAMNAYNIQMRDDLYQILSAIKDDPDVHVVIFKGAGEKAFCAGADLSEFLTAPSPIAARKIRWQRDVWGLFLSIPQPIIAALHGYVLGSGIEIALCCDIRIASKNAKFGLPEVALGMIPAAGGTQTLPRTVGKSKALEMLLIDEWIDGDEAFRIGLVNHVVSPDTLYDYADEMAKKIASHDPAALKIAKQAVVRGMDLELTQGLYLEKGLAVHLSTIKKQQPKT
jgi:enoyl-CoA hydratase